MSKKQIVKNYLLENVDMKSLKSDYQNSWLINKPFEWIHGSGIVSSHFYRHIKKAIEVAEYKYPKSDRTWETALNVEKDIINDNMHYLKSK